MCIKQCYMLSVRLEHNNVSNLDIMFWKSPSSILFLGSCIEIFLCVFPLSFGLETRLAELVRMEGGCFPLEEMAGAAAGAKTSSSSLALAGPPPKKNIIETMFN